MGAPRVDLSRTADAWHFIADISALSADPDLTAVSKKPKCAPQLTRLVNNTASSISVVLVGEDDGLNAYAAGEETFTVPVPAQCVLDIPFPVKSIDESASGAASVHFFWFVGGSTEWNA